MFNNVPNYFKVYQGGREWKPFLEIFKIQVDDIILPWETYGFSMYWWVPMC